MSGRQTHIDWLRGLAVLCMIEWHVLDGWVGRDGRDPSTWLVLGTIGGVAAPLFLFLAGLAVPLAGARGEAKGQDRRTVAWALQKRGWQIFALAHLFRAQSFLFNPHARWSGLLKPDILNVLGLSLVVAAWIWGRATTPRRLWALVAAPAIAILALTPSAASWWWPTLLHPRLEAYIRPVGNLGVFQLFPWTAVVLAGVLVGMAIARGDDRSYRRLAAASAVAVLAGHLVGWIIKAPSPFEAFGLPVFVMARMGEMTLALALAWWWHRRWPIRPANPVVVLGQASLIVYWVHVELAYGALSYPLHNALPLGWGFVALAAVTLAMWPLAVWWKNRPSGGPWIPDHLRGTPSNPHRPAVRSTL